MEDTDFSPVFTVCVPTYNRGRKALNVARKLMPKMEPDWELLFLDNFSFQEMDEYRQLAELTATDRRLSYIRHDHNILFNGNLAACFEMSKAPYIMAISDEDFAEPETIRYALEVFAKSPGVGLIRGSMAPAEGVKPINSLWLVDNFFQGGAEAMLGFAFSTNYFSGTIYNKRLVLEKGLIDRLRNVFDDHRTYPHLYLDLLTAAVADVVTTSRISCYEGEDQLAGSYDPNKYSSTYSFGNRIDQFVVLRNAVVEAVGLVGEPIDKALLARLFLHLCEKYMYLVTKVNSPLYVKNKLHLNFLHEAMLYICCAGISMYLSNDEMEANFFNEIQALYAKFKPASA